MLIEEAIATGDIIRNPYLKAVTYARIGTKFSPS